MIWKNLAPNLIRQRVIIEGTTTEMVSPDRIKSYLIELAKVTGMQVLDDPIIYNAHELGYGGWVLWKTSGCAFYTYPISPALFSVDCHTCKPFDPEAAYEFTKQYLNAIECVWQEVKI